LFIDLNNIHESNILKHTLWVLSKKVEIGILYHVDVDAYAFVDVVKEHLECQKMPSLP
jgi:hypothetical protein